jgi:hypothetical protein
MIYFKIILQKQSFNAGHSNTNTQSIHTNIKCCVKKFIVRCNKFIHAVTYQVHQTPCPFYINAPPAFLISLFSFFEIHLIAILKG